MTDGEVVGIFIAPTAGAPMVAKARVRAVPGCGVEGDRYYSTDGGTLYKNGKIDPGKEITLIEDEAIGAIEREDSISLQPGCSRRNIVTRGVALNHLVGLEFTVGQVRIKGIRLCEPCGHLEKLTQKGVRKSLVHRGGLRAQILTEGHINVGDEIRAMRLKPVASLADHR